MARTRRFVLNYVGSIANQFFLAGVGLLTTKLVLQWLGEERYGAFRVTQDWLGYLVLLELALGGTLHPMLAKALGRGDPTMVRQTLQAAVRAYFRLGLFALFAGLASALIITRLIPVAPAHAGELRGAWLLAVLGMVFFFPLAPFRPLIEANQRGYWIAGLCSCQGLVIAVLSVLFAWTGWGIFGQSLAMVFGSVWLYGSITWLGTRQYPGVLRGIFKETPDLELRRSLWDLSWPTLVRALCFQIGLMSDTIVIALMLGPVFVVPFFVTQRLISLAQNQLRNISGASWAGMAELHVQGFQDLFNRRLVELTGLVAVLGMAGLAPVVAYNGHFVRWWLGANHYGGDLVTGLAAVNTFLLALFTLWSGCMVGTGHVRLLLPITLISTAINLAASVILVRPLGIAGPLVGTLAAALCTYVWYLPLVLKRVFETKLGPLMCAILVPVLLGLPYVAGLWWIAHNHEPEGWMGLAVEMGSAILLYLALAWWVVLNREKRVELMTRTRALLLGA
ncbi:MAG TPA: lipopolysaccharide biosynthesis protein [Gemmataceae bacterium]|jgi:O-antigen/teichoic acid export membrane protein